MKLFHKSVLLLMFIECVIFEFVLFYEKIHFDVDIVKTLMFF